jgi:hypothetical protein
MFRSLTAQEPRLQRQIDLTLSKTRPRALRGNLIVPLAALVVAFAATASAWAISAPIHTTTWVNIRPGPSTSSGNSLATMPPGTSPSFHCWTQGQVIGYVDVWFKATWNGVTGYYASYYDDSSYRSDNDITTKYGIPKCGTPPPPSGGVTPAEQAAVNWAKARVGQNAYYNLCLAFVFDAYSAAGVNLRSWVTVPIGSDTYPVDIWGHFAHGHTGTGASPPVGALVFWASPTGRRDYSHVALSIGNGQTVSTYDSLGSVIHIESIATHNSYANELGWWLPDQ